MIAEKAYGNDPNDPELYPGGENDRYLEIWNLVFSQFNHNPDDTYTPLPKKNIDTGMGLERIVSVIQDVPTNFETDLFMPIIKKTEQLANVKYGVAKTSDTAYKVIADHIRTVSFAISDGALPSNDGRGYVLRRLIRRAVRFAKEIGIEKPFMYELVKTVGEIMKDFYPTVLQQHDFIQNIIKVEEERFHETLNEGLDILTTIIEKEKGKGSTVFPGEEVFRLYDTYGFPKELTAEYVEQLGFSMNEAGYDREMEKQRERLQKRSTKVDSMHVQDEVLGKLDVESEFIGYDRLESDTKIVALLKDGELVDCAKKDEEVLIFLQETPFYAESGGQIADHGIITNSNGKASVKHVQKSPKSQNIHRTVVEEGELRVGDLVKAVVDSESRNLVIKNHTATHLLHQALKDVLGAHVNQAGSLVAADRLRFDFSHFNAVSIEELNQIEKIVNEKIWDSISLDISYKSLKEAKEMGAMALFGEKYGEIVRVVRIGDYSLELCGGIHVRNTSEIGLFKIVSEGGIGAGTRRIEAVTSKFAYQFLSEKVHLLQNTAQLVKTKDEKVPERVEALFQEIKALQKENESLSAKLSNLEVSSILEQVEEVSGIKVLAQKLM